MHPPRLIPALLAALLILAACAGQPAADTMDAAPAPQEVAASSDTMADDEMAEDDMAESDMAEDDMAASDRPAWQQIALIDARSGEAFTLADFGDKPVFVEPFATWCSNCRRQLGNVQQAYAELGDEAVFVALSVEPNIGNDALVDYADKEGFGYMFAAMPPEMLQELAGLFGQTVSNPPATPHFVIWPDGSTTELSTGFEAPEAIVEQFRSAG